MNFLKARVWREPICLGTGGGLMELLEISNQRI
jgi:hypothetical protein